MLAPLPHPMDETPAATVAELQARVMLWAREIGEHLKVAPTLETLTVEIDPATLPLSVLVETKLVRGVIRLRTVSADSGEGVANTGIEWTTVSDALDAGVVIESLSGCSSGTKYALTLGIVGERV